MYFILLYIYILGSADISDWGTIYIKHKRSNWLLVVIRFNKKFQDVLFNELYECSEVVSTLNRNTHKP